MKMDFEELIDEHNREREERLVPKIFFLRMKISSIN